MIKARLTSFFWGLLSQPHMLILWAFFLFGVWGWIFQPNDHLDAILYRICAIWGFFAVFETTLGWNKKATAAVKRNYGAYWTLMIVLIVLSSFTVEF